MNKLSKTIMLIISIMQLLLVVYGFHVISKAVEVRARARLERQQAIVKTLKSLEADMIAEFGPEWTIKID